MRQAYDGDSQQGETAMRAYSKFGSDRYLGKVIGEQGRGARREVIVLHLGQLAAYYYRDVILQGV